jgi:hypothetical protein
MPMKNLVSGRNDFIYPFLSLCTSHTIAKDGASFGSALASSQTIFDFAKSFLPMHFQLKGK